MWCWYKNNSTYKFLQKETRNELREREVKKILIIGDYK